MVYWPGISGPVHEQCSQLGGKPCWWPWECWHRKPLCHKIGVRCVSEPEVDSERSQYESRIRVTTPLAPGLDFRVAATGGLGQAGRKSTQSGFRIRVAASGGLGPAGHQLTRSSFRIRVSASGVLGPAGQQPTRSSFRNILIWPAQDIQSLVHRPLLVDIVSGLGPAGRQPT